MSTKSCQRNYGGSIIRAKIRSEGARKSGAKSACEADRAEAEAWSLQMEAYGGPAQPSPTIEQCVNSGLGWLEVECSRCKECRSCRRPRYSPPVRMIKLTEQRELSPYVWVHPSEE